MKRIEKRRAMEEERVLGDIHRKRTEAAQRQLGDRAEIEGRRTSAKTEDSTMALQGRLTFQDQPITITQTQHSSYLPKIRTPHFSSSPSPQLFHTSESSSSLPLARVPQQMAHQDQMEKVDIRPAPHPAPPLGPTPTGGGLGLGLRQVSSQALGARTAA